MPQQAWSKKRERQYDAIKESLEERGRDEGTAQEIAARTVNKERARSGEAEIRNVMRGQGALGCAGRGVGLGACQVGGGHTGSLGGLSSSVVVAPFPAS